MEENNVIPNGFKMTELGALPEEWKMVKPRERLNKAKFFRMCIGRGAS